MGYEPEEKPRRVKAPEYRHIGGPDYPEKGNEWTNSIVKRYSIVISIILAFTLGSFLVNSLYTITPHMPFVKWWCSSLFIAISIGGSYGLCKLEIFILKWIIGSEE